MGDLLPNRMAKLFGTDGIRGNADTDLSPDLVRDVGRALGAALHEGLLLPLRPTGPRTVRPRVVVGRDTRISGPKLELALTEGLRSQGVDVLGAGVLPTAGVAYLTDKMDAGAGVVISASHNPPEDNGIKIFGPGGWKLSADAEQRIEALVGNVGAAGGDGAWADLPAALEMYVAHLTSHVHHGLAGLRVVVDGANGAASQAAPDALRSLGAEVITLNADGDGARINEGCGALHPDVVAARVRELGAVGLSFDGDADRVLLCDETGRVVDGDAILALLALHLRDEGRLRGNGIVATVMANEALRLWCGSERIALVETPVGDRHVLAAMRSRDLALGGEQSGHVIVLDRCTTGDGILVAIELLDMLAACGKRLADLVPFEPFPQVLVNVRGVENGRAIDAGSVRRAIDEAEKRLGADGRVLVRPSGTEPMVRVMVEARDVGVANELAGMVADAVRRELDGT